GEKALRAEVQLDFAHAGDRSETSCPGVLSRATGRDELRFRSSGGAFGWACAAGIRGARVPRGLGGGNRGRPRSRGRPELVAPFSCEVLRSPTVPRPGRSTGASSEVPTRLGDGHDRLPDE